VKYIVAATLLLAGCMSLAKLPPREYYVLNDLGTAAMSMRGEQNDRALLISETSVSPFYDTQSLVFSRAPGQRAYYQFAAWTERPGSRLT
jgi:cholesterol transport system auxiliary component